MQNLNYFRALKRWIPGAVMLTLIAGFIYVACQQIIRQAGNDPQIQIAEDVAQSLETGTPTTAFGSSFKIDLKNSLNSFIMLVDDSGKVVESTGTLNGKAPTPPKGIIDSARKSGENRVTWEPEKGVRDAVVVKHYNDNGASGFVLVGRSLREVESREKTLLTETIIFWIVTLVAWFLFKLWEAYFQE